MAYIAGYSKERRLFGAPEDFRGLAWIPMGSQWQPIDAKKSTMGFDSVSFGHPWIFRGHQ